MLTQSLLALSAIGSAISAYQSLSYDIAEAAPSIVLLCFLVALIILAQFRRPPARWAFGLGAGFFWIYISARTWLRLVAERPPGEPSEQQFSMVFGSILFTLLGLLATARVLFGEAAKRYFASGRSVARTEDL